MPPKRKTPGSEKAPSSKRVRIASPASPTRPAAVPPPTRTPGKRVDDKPDPEPPTTAKRGPGRPRKTPLAPVTPKAPKPRKTPTTTPARKGRSAQRDQEQQDQDVKETEAELPPPPAQAPKDVFSPVSSADELAAPQRVSNPTPRRRNITRKPRITYKSRRPSLLSRGGSDSGGDEEEHDPISVTKSSPIMVAKKTVPVPSTPATTIKPRARPPRARKKGAPEVPVSVEVAPVAVMEVTPSAAVRRGARLSYGSLHETDAEGEDDLEMMDEDVVGGDGTIAAVVQVKEKEKGAYKERASRRRSLPTPAKESLALDGMVDPFAIPEGKGEVEQNGDVVEEKEQQKFSEKALKALKKRVMAKLVGRKRCKLVGVAEEEEHVRNLLEQTVVAGEGNSMLIIGARGSGKTTLVETAIADLREEHNGDFLVVRLNGFMQTDDRIALREIWRQLGVEMELDEKEQPKTNFADTLSSILAILSHPDELKELTEDQTDDPSTTALSVIFLLEEFDLFATHPRQTLLYNLFDIAQSRKAPIAVVGTTTRIDVVESLEKRVKSRFSHRTVHLRNPNTLKSFWDVCKAGLGVDMDEVDSELHISDEERLCFEAWNTHLDNLYKDDKPFQRLLKRIFAQSKDAKSFFNSCILPISTLTTFPSGAQFASAANTLSPPDNILSILDGLTDLELTLLIAAARLEVISDTETCNFNMAYDEYARLTGAVKAQSAASGVMAGRVWGREVAGAAWERLAEYGLVTKADLGAGKGGKAREGRMWRVEVGLGEVGKCLEAGKAGVGRGGLGRWCRDT